jgi:hypothetical protein
LGVAKLQQKVVVGSGKLPGTEMVVLEGVLSVCANAAMLRREKAAATKNRLIKLVNGANVFP